jgi:hypothetical protein
VTQYTAVKASDTENKEPPTLHPIPKVHPQKEIEQFEARRSMIEALIHRKEFTKAKQFLYEMKNIYTQYKQFKSQIQALENKISDESEEPQHSPRPAKETYFDRNTKDMPQHTITQIHKNELSQKQKKIQKLRQLLTRIEQFQSQTTHQP